eukprot:TRINITY_DN11085_c0_g1_i1.p2 TRINITY_DN11085_c0_g1~~TRINITY_DN11085_c0_g1_i1.p2  ORF type:complete len:67 (+),score=10.86 TRINITY_DN11085_c0_g1_i1:367-567(+)
MDQFEKQFEDLDLNSEYMESAMQQSTAQSMPENQVDDLMHQVNNTIQSFSLMCLPCLRTTISKYVR